MILCYYIVLLYIYYAILGLRKKLFKNNNFFYLFLKYTDEQIISMMMGKVHSGIKMQKCGRRNNPLALQ